MLRIIDHETRELQCNWCGYKHTKTVPVIDPDDFTKPKKAHYDSIFFCGACKTPSGIRTFFSKNKKTGEITTKFDVLKNVAKIYKIKPPENSITIRPKLKSYK